MLERLSAVTPGQIVVYARNEYTFICKVTKVNETGVELQQAVNSLGFLEWLHNDYLRPGGNVIFLEDGYYACPEHIGTRVWFHQTPQPAHVLRGALPNSKQEE